MRWIPLAVILLGAAMFPYSLNRIQDRGYDFPIYYRAGQGEIGTDFSTGAFTYNARIAHLFRPLVQFPLPVAFGIFYALTLISFGYMARLLIRSGLPRTVSISVGVVALGSAFIILRLGNIAGLLAFACLSPVGSVLAGCIKPYCFLFTLLHAARFCHRRYAPRSD